MTFVEILFTTAAWLHWPLFVISIFFAYMLLKLRGQPAPVNFGMSILFMGLWILVTVMDIFRVGSFPSLAYSLAGFITALWTLHYFLLFSFYYPVRNFNSKYLVSIFYMATGLVTIFCLIPGTLTTLAWVDFPFRYREINPIGLTVYNFYFLFLAIWAFRNLFKTYERSDGSHRDNLKKIIFGTAFTVLVNLFLSLINFYYTSFALTPIGIIFTFFVLLYIFQIIYPKGGHMRKRWWTKI